MVQSRRSRAASSSSSSSPWPSANNISHLLTRMFTDSIYGDRVGEEFDQDPNEEGDEDDWTRIGTMDEDDHERFRLETYRNSARIYIALIIGVGIVGNVACLVLYRRPSFARYRSSRYLSALAVADLTSLICLGMIWFKGLGFRWQDRSELACVASIYVSNTATFLSAWFVMLLTADMAWTLRRPYRLNMFEEGRSIMRRICAVVFIGLGANSWTWSAARLIREETTTAVVDVAGRGRLGPADNSMFANFSNPNSTYPTTETPQQSEPQSECQLTFNGDEYFARCMIIFDMMVSFTIPLLITLCLNGYIGYKLLSAARKRRLYSRFRSASVDHNRNVSSSRTLMITTTPPPRTLHQNHRHHMLLQQESAFQSRYSSRTVIRFTLAKTEVTRKRRRSFFSGFGKETTVFSLLIAKSLTYILLNLPTHAYRFWNIFRSSTTTSTGDDQQSTKGEREREFLVNMVVYMMFYTQFSLNFLLYSGHACKKRANPNP